MISLRMLFVTSEPPRGKLSSLRAPGKLAAQEHSELCQAAAVKSKIKES